jgi:hypothetical protein
MKNGKRVACQDWITITPLSIGLIYRATYGGFRSATIAPRGLKSTALTPTVASDAPIFGRK